MADTFDLPKFRRQHATPFARGLSNRKTTEAWRHRQRLSELLDILVQQCPEYEEFVDHYIALRVETEEAGKQLRGLVEIISPTRPNIQRIKQERSLEKAQALRRRKVVGKETEVAKQEAVEVDTPVDTPTEQQFIYKTPKQPPSLLSIVEEGRLEAERAELARGRSEMGIPGGDIEEEGKSS